MPDRPVRVVLDVMVERLREAGNVRPITRRGFFAGALATLVGRALPGGTAQFVVGAPMVFGSDDSPSSGRCTVTAVDRDGFTVEATDYGEDRVFVAGTSRVEFERKHCR